MNAVTATTATVAQVLIYAEGDTTLPVGTQVSFASQTGREWIDATIIAREIREPGDGFADEQSTWYYVAHPGFGGGFRLDWIAADRIGEAIVLIPVNPEGKWLATNGIGQQARFDDEIHARQFTQGAGSIVDTIAQLNRETDALLAVGAAVLAEKIEKATELADPLGRRVGDVLIALKTGQEWRVRDMRLSATHGTVYRVEKVGQEHIVDVMHSDYFRKP